MKTNCLTYLRLPFWLTFQDAVFFLEDLSDGFGGQAPRRGEFRGSEMSFKDWMTIAGFVILRVREGGPFSKQPPTS